MIGLGRYNLLFKLGQGGMGAVYLARQRKLKRFCAVKVISANYAQDEDSAKRFLNEAQAAASLSHPNVVSIFDCDEYKKQYFIAMEFIEGMSLGEVIKTLGPLPLPLALHWLNQAAIGLDYLHGKGVIHRDIKPDNMMIDGEGTMKIMDLGLAKHHFEGNLSMTSTGTIMGSPHYMSPEQIQDSKTADHRSDLYSLGIVFYQILTGKVPYNKTSASAVYMAHLSEPMPSVAAVRPGITQPVDALISQLTAKDRNQRIQTSSDLIEELKPWIASNPLNEETTAYWTQFERKKHLVGELLEREKIDPSKIDLEISDDSDTPKSPSFVPKLVGVLALPMIVLLGLLGLGAWFLLKAGKDKTPPPTTDKATNIPIAPGKNTIPPKTPTTSISPSQPKQGGLYVKTQPEQALVMFRSSARASPATFENIPVGHYTVKATSKGYKDTEKEVDVEEGKFVELTISLARIPGFANITTQPTGASVIVKDKVLGQTPYKLEGGDGDTVECHLKMDGYEERTFKVMLTGDGAEHAERLLVGSKPIGGGTAGKNVSAPNRDQFLRENGLNFSMAVMFDGQRYQLLNRIPYGGDRNESVGEYIDRTLTSQQKEKLATLREQAISNLSQNMDATQAMDQALTDTLKMTSDQKHQLADSVEQVKVALKKRAEDRVKGFKVTGTSTLGGTSTATLNNQIVQQGKTYTFRRGGMEFQYTVSKIDNDNITLLIDDIEIAIPSSETSLDTFREQ